MAGTEKPRRGFDWASEAWHAKTTLSGNTVDALTVGMYYDGDGCDFEICLEWVTIGLTPTLKVCVYSDGLRAFTEWADFFSALAVLDNANPQPRQVAALLSGLGFTDMTEREKPESKESPETAKTVAELVRIDVETTIANEGLRGVIDVNTFHNLPWRAMCRAAGSDTPECYKAGDRGDIIIGKARQEAAKTGRAFARCAREQLAAWESRQVTDEEAAAFHEQEDRKARDVDGMHEPDA